MSLDRFAAMASALNMPIPQKPEPERRTFLGLTDMQWRVWQGHARRRWFDAAAADRACGDFLRAYFIFRWCESRAREGWDQQPIAQRARAAA